MRRTESATTAGFLFLLWPFGMFIRALFVYGKPWAKNVVWLFVAFFGFTLIFGESKDANRYVERFLQMQDFHWNFDEFFMLLYNDETKYVDIVQPLLSFILSRFTDDPRILLAVFGLIFGYFYSRNIWFLIDYHGKRLKPEVVFLVLTFSLIVGFWEVNGFRFWTAAHVFVLGAFQYFYGQSKRGLLVAVSSVFFHAAFALPVFLLLFHIPLCQQLKVFYVLFVLSFFISEIDFAFIRENLMFLPALFYERASQYISEEVAARRLEQAANLSWHAVYYGKALKAAMLILGSYFIYARRSLPNVKILPALVSFSYLLYGVSNILSVVPSFGRFLFLASLLVVAAAVLLLQSECRLGFRRPFLWCVLPLLLFFDVVAVRKSFDYISLYTVFGNPVTSWFGPGEMALIDFIK